MSSAACTMRGSGAGASEESALFTWPSAQLFLVHEKEEALLQKGAFTLLLAHHSRSAHLVVVEASVGDVRWPVGKDCLVTTSIAAAAAPAHPLAAPSRFLFALRLPASHDQLTYQLLLCDYDRHAVSSSHFRQISKQLQALLALYATLDQHHKQMQPPCTNPGSPPPAKRSLMELEEAAGEFWASRADDKQVRFGKQEADISKEQTGAEIEDMDQLMDCQSSHESSSTSTTTTTTNSPAGVSKRMMKRMQKARRISAISKLFSKAVVRGLINAKAHIVQEADVSDEQITIALLQDGGVKPAVASVDAITKVVEAVEGGVPQTGQVKSSTKAANVAGCGRVLDNISALASWTINEVGLRLVLNAAMAVNKVQVAGAIAPTSALAAQNSASSSSCLTSSNSSSMSRSVSTSTSASAASLRPSSLRSSSTDLSVSPSARRPPRPPRRVDFLLHEVSSPFPVNSNAHIVK